MPPQPEAPAVFDDDSDEDLPTPPPCGTDLITFSESEDQRERSDLENESLSVERTSTALGWGKKRNFTPRVECTCESLHPLQTIDPVRESKTSSNSLFFVTEDTAEAGRPAPIVLTRARNGPIKAAVTVKRSNSTSGSKSTSSSSSGSFRPSLPQSVSVDFSHERSTPSLSIRQNSLPEPRSVARPYSSSDIVTIEHPPKFVKAFQDHPLANTVDEHEPFTQATDPLIPETPKEEKDLNRVSRDSNDFPPPPPSIEDSSTLDQGDCPWVSLMSRFQVDEGVSSIEESDEPLLPQRRPKTKSSTSEHEQRMLKFRSYAPKAKPTYVEVKNSEEHDQKSETCV